MQQVYVFETLPRRLTQMLSLTRPEYARYLESAGSAAGLGAGVAASRPRHRNDDVIRPLLGFDACPRKFPVHQSNVLFPDFGNSGAPRADATVQQLPVNVLPNVVDVDISTGATVIGAYGETIGTIVEVYLDNQTGCSDWAAVSIGGHRWLVPLTEARVVENAVQIPVTVEQVCSAPHRDPATALTVDDKHDLDRHFGVTCRGRP